VKKASKNAKTPSLSLET